MGVWYNSVMKFYCFCLLFVLFVGGVSVAFGAPDSCGDVHEHEHDAASCEKEEKKVVVVPVAVQKTMGLTTARAERRRLASTRSFPGRFELTPDARQTAATPVAGRLSLYVAPLARVKKGDRLFSVFSPDLLKRDNEIAVLEKRLAVYRGLKTTNAELESELTVRRTARTAILAGAAEANGIVTVFASADGMVDKQFVQEGAWVEIGSAVMEIVDPHALRFTALVAAADAAQLSDGLSATVGAAKGSVRLGVGDASGLIPVYVLFEGTVPGAIAGTRDAAVCVLDANETPHVAVPTDAIVTIGLQPTVFVRDAHHPDHFRAVAVTTGVRGGGWTAVEGLADGTEVVCAGAYELKLALPSANAAKPAGHFHADGQFHEGEH